MLALRPHHQGSALPDRFLALQDDSVARRARGVGAQPADRARAHPVSDVRGQMRDVRDAGDAKQPPRCIGTQWPQLARRHARFDDAAAARKVAAAPHRQPDVGTHAGDERQQHFAKVVQRRRGAHVGAARDLHVKRRAGRDHHRQQRLQHQRDAARRAHVEREPAAAHRARLERDFVRAQCEAFDARAADLADRPHRRQVLRCEARLVALCAYGSNADRRSGERRERDSVAHELAAAGAI